MKTAALVVGIIVLAGLAYLAIASMANTNAVVNLNSEPLCSELAKEMGSPLPDHALCRPGG